MPAYVIAVFVTLLVCIAIHALCALYVFRELDNDRKLGNISFPIWKSDWFLLMIFTAGWRHTDKPGVRWAMRIWSAAWLIPVLIGLLVSCFW